MRRHCKLDHGQPMRSRWRRAPRGAAGRRRGRGELRRGRVRAAARARARDARSGSGSNVPPNTPRTAVMPRGLPPRRAAARRIVRLEARPRFLQERDLLRRRRAAEDRIAVRITAEAADDRRMLFRPVERCAVACLRASRVNSASDRSCIAGLPSARTAGRETRARSDRACDRGPRPRCRSQWRALRHRPRMRAACRDRRCA